ncbi:serine/threonine-protein phosphatase 7 long form [Salvia divinorum]
MPVRQKEKRHAKKKSSRGESSSSRMDVRLGDDSDEDFANPPPPTSWVRGRHSVSHTGGTGEDIHLDRDFQTSPRSSVRDAFFDVDLETVIVPDTPNPPYKYSQGLRSLFIRKRQ